MPVGVPVPADEFPHALPDAAVELPYKDTWMLCFHDVPAEVTVLVHLTLSANRLPGLRATVGVRHGRRRLQETVYETPLISTGDAGGTASLGCDLVRVDILEPAWTPAKHLRLTVRHRVDDEDVELVADFRGRYFGVDSSVLTPGLIPSGEGIQQLGHAEQACTVTGRLRWGPDDIEIAAGNGYRDRSWGFRKSDKMAVHGYAFAQAHLPEATCGLLSWRHPDAQSSAALPVGAWLADAQGVYAATDGLLHLSPTGRGHRLALSFSDGRSIDLTTRSVLSELHYPYHEPEMSGPAIGTLCWDQHLAFDSAQGPCVGLLNIGTPFVADVLRDSTFCVAGGGGISVAGPGTTR
jgi:hypothetical protein